ncbi:glycine-rich protein 1-like [Halyomorpha halys]|uniref:glycine-rich protein 1-like n=1 Tax=Halyomorpha halys TaxID=286706 RepID=UPI0034D1E432
MNYNFRKACVKVHTRIRPPPREERGAAGATDVENATLTSRAGVSGVAAHRTGARESGRRTMGGSGAQAASGSGRLITSGSGGLAAGGSGGRAVGGTRRLTVESDPGGLAAGGASSAGAGGSLLLGPPLRRGPGVVVYHCPRRGGGPGSLGLKKRMRLCK